MGKEIVVNVLINRQMSQAWELGLIENHQPSRPLRCTSGLRVRLLSRALMQASSRLKSLPLVVSPERPTTGCLKKHGLAALKKNIENIYGYNQRHEKQDNL